MNIYITDLLAVEAAKNLCDEHIKSYPNKVLTICRNALATSDPSPNIHEEWCKISKQNFEWMIEFGLAICRIHEALFLKTHEAKLDLQKIELSLQKSKRFPKLGVTRRPMNVAQKFASLGYLEANREEYRTRYRVLNYHSSRRKPKWLI